MAGQIDAATALSRLLEVVATLLGPQGCPWDREQTHRSLIPYVLEEAYELVEALESGPPQAVKEELGDVLFQVVFHAQLAQQSGAFDLADVTTALADKLVQRHPHVFAPGGVPAPESARAVSARAVSEAWHARKAAARGSHLEGIPATLPALSWAAQVSTRAARAGFEWPHHSDILDKIEEELREFRASLPPRPAPAGAAGAADSAPPAAPAPSSAGAETDTEFGDLLFALVQAARWQGVDAEAALRRSTRKFIRRFQWMESALKRQGTSPAALSLEAWDELWNQAKRAETQNVEGAGT